MIDDFVFMACGSNNVRGRRRKQKLELKRKPKNMLKSRNRLCKLAQSGDDLGLVNSMKVGGSEGTCETFLKHQK